MRLFFLYLEIKRYEKEKWKKEREIEWNYKWILKINIINIFIFYS